MLSSKPWNCKSRPNARAIFPCSIVWWWGTPSTGVCSGFTAIRFRRKCSTEVIEWTPSWFGRRASTMELSLCHQSQSGMLVYCSCSLLLLWPTLDPSPLIVPSYQPWKHMMILKMVIMYIIHMISIISIICGMWHYNTYAYYSFYCNYCWLLYCRMVGICWISVVYELDYKKPILYVVPIQSILGNFLWYLLVTLQLFLTECATPFRSLQATAGMAQAMGAGCGSSTRGHWDGPVTCNKSHGIQAREAAGRKVPCEHDASPFWAMLPSALAVLWRFYLILSAVPWQDKHSVESWAL